MSHRTVDTMRGSKYVIGVWLAITVVVVVLSRVVEGTTVVRVAQAYSIFVGLMLYRYQSWELKTFFICIVFAFLFLVKLFAYGDAYLTGFMPMGILALGLLYYRIFRRSPKIFVSIWYIALLLSCVYVVAMVEILGNDTNNVVRGSRNHITTLILPLFVALFVSARCSEPYRNKMKRIYVLGLATALILIMYTGRTGVMSAAIIVLAVFLAVVQSRHWRTLFVVFGSFLIASFIFSPDISGIFETSSGLQRLDEEQVAEDIRFLLWAEAVGYMTDSSYALGVPSGFWTENLSGGLTVHNSYFEIYGLYGWIGLIVAMTVIILMFYRVAEVDFIVSILVFALLLRSVFDTTLLDLVLGPVYIFITTVVVRQGVTR